MSHSFPSIPFQHGIDLARMEPGEYAHSAKHQAAIEDIQEPLMRNQVTVISLGVLGKTEDGSDEDEQAACVQSVKIALPSQVSLDDSRCRVSHHAGMKYDGNDQEEREEEDLDHEAADDDVFARGVRRETATRLNASAGALKQKRDHVAGHEEFCQPAAFDDCMALAFGEEDDSAKFHVD